MSLPRRLMNMIVTSRYNFAPSLSCVDLRSQLFGDAITPESTTRDRSEEPAEQCHYPGRRILEPPASLKMETLQLPSPIFTYGPLNFPRDLVVDCFPLTDGKVVLSERSGPTTLVDARARHLVHLPDLHKPKEKPISLFVPSADGAGCGSLYVMERIPTSDYSERSGQFEAFVHGGKPILSSLWHRRVLRSPPFLPFRHGHNVINSYAVIGSDICISTDCAGTYRLDTARDLWVQVGSRWMLPFYGKVEYAPELKLWFGFSSQSEDERLAAADLGTMDSQPQLIGDFKEFEPPEDWRVTDRSRFVYLGSGCFCIVRFYKTLPDHYDHEPKEDWIVVFTGVEATRIEHDKTCGGTGNGKVKFTKHKSRCLISQPVDDLKGISSGSIITDVL